MVQKLILPLMAALGFVAVGCEDYEAPEFKNSGPSVTVSNIAPGDTIKKAVRFNLTSQDDRYINSLGVYLINKDEDNDLEYGYGFPSSLINEPLVNLYHRISVDTLPNRLVNGNYILKVESKDVQGLSDFKEIPIVIDGDSPNIDTLTTFKVQIWDSTHKNLSSYFTLKALKTFAPGALKNPLNVAAVDIIVAKIGGIVKFYSPKETKSLPASSGFTAGKDSLNNSTTSFMLTNLTNIGLLSLKTSTEIRKIYSDLIQGGATPSQSIAIGVNKIYIVKVPEKNLFAVIQVGGLSENKIKLRAVFKRFYVPVN